MDRIKGIPEQFFGLFQSKNRYIYIEALLLLYEEYLYNDYFLTKETCIQLLHDRFHSRILQLSKDENEIETEEIEPVASHIFSRLLYFQWIRKVEDYTTFRTNVVIPDYASVFIEAFRHIEEPEANETDIYIQNVYTNIYSFYHDKKAGIELLRTAMVNASNLNRALQEMLHNMDKFFEALLKKDSYENLLEEHLIGYVTSIVDKKYGLLKTSDNFYIYKNDIKRLLRAIEEDEERLHHLKDRLIREGAKEEDAWLEIQDIIAGVERGIMNMERRIAYIDAEHTKYIRATVRRLEYLLSSDENMSGQIVTLLNTINADNREEILDKVAKAVRLHDNTILTKDLMYKRRGKRKPFEETVVALEESVELSKEEILLANVKKIRYSKEQIEAFITDRMVNGRYSTKEQPITSDVEFELLILAYDYSLRKKSNFEVQIGENAILINKGFSYPNLIFTRRSKSPKE